MGATTAGTAGGAATVTLATTNLPSHSHTIAHTHSINHDHANWNTASGGGHTHRIPTNQNGGSGLVCNVSSTGLATAAGRSINTFSEGSSHAHSIDLPNFTGTSGASSAADSGNTGSGTAFNILPTYLTTYYIMRVK
jgi:hypothetical protein